MEIKGSAEKVKHEWEIIEGYSAWKKFIEAIGLYIENSQRRLETDSIEKVNFIRGTLYAYRKVLDIPKDVESVLRTLKGTKKEE